MKNVKNKNDHSFCVRAPYLYPLYKIHKLNKQQIEDKVKPPNRMVTSSVNGPTYRLGVFLESVLQPVATAYCEGELVKDTTDYMRRSAELSDKNVFANSELNLVAMDICALYPNIRIDVALEAVESALTSNSNYTSTEIKAIIMLLNYTLRNSVVHYRGAWYISKEGAPTGNPEVPPVANILVKYVLDEKILVHPTIMPMNKLEDRSRFLDDIWGLWVDTNDAFMSFLSQVNEVGQTFGVTFTGDCGQSVEFLDVTTSICDGHLKTVLYIKPTDSTRYLKNLKKLKKNRLFQDLNQQSHTSKSQITTDRPGSRP